ncbi:2-iminobutanoate/2-iminopropanoate deaminase isoform X2 [Cervus canadensis]|uniref:2-iminobutanoate/2-iminopropanoate deaminase isoform X2 n=1 Tax=Cervus canadensis TaxID=1574408 RepID=UPI001C9E3503|nr:2-iminobutanoate/2-iminopropanoate deaminase isoform X2 [Cervus canadensis]
MSSLVRRVISTAKAPAAIGPYSQAVLVDRTIYISGQLGMDPASGQLVPGGVAEEAKQALKNIGEILKAAGCDFTNVVKATVLLADINDFSTVNDVYKQCFLYSPNHFSTHDCIYYCCDEVQPRSVLPQNH